MRGSGTDLVDTSLALDASLKGELAKAVAFIKKDMRIAVSYRLQFLFQFLQIFFGVAVIYFIGRMLAGAGNSSLLEKYHTDYFSFALVGLAVNSYLRVGMEGITNDVRQTMNQGVLEALCAPPINYTWLLLCSSLWQFTFETVRVVSYFLIAMILFGMRLSGANWTGAILALLLTAGIFLMLGVMSCSVLVLVKRGDPIYWIFSRTAGLLAGVMFPISVFPHWLRMVALCFPLTHSLEAIRQCLFSGASVGEVAVNIWVLVAFIVILTPLTVFVNNLCMRKAKMSGAFTTH